MMTAWERALQRMPVRYCRMVRSTGALDDVDVPAVCTLFSSLANQNKCENGHPLGPAPGILVSATFLTKFA
eukprot:1136316-Pelagomonas_calceolata.AAC.4